MQLLYWNWWHTSLLSILFSKGTYLMESWTNWWYNICKGEIKANWNKKHFQVIYMHWINAKCFTPKKGSHVYFLLQVFWVILLFDINVVLMLPWWPDVTIVQSDVTIVVQWQLSTGSIHDYLFCYCPLVSILFEVLRITSHHMLH